MGGDKCGLRVEQIDACVLAPGHDGECVAPWERRARERGEDVRRLSALLDEVADAVGVEKEDRGDPETLMGAVEGLIAEADTARASLSAARREVDEMRARAHDMEAVAARLDARLVNANVARNEALAAAARKDEALRGLLAAADGLIGPKSDFPRLIVENKDADGMTDTQIDCHLWEVRRLADAVVSARAALSPSGGKGEGT